MVPMELPLLILPDDHSLSKPSNKRWHRAFARIYCTRAFSLAPKKKTCKEGKLLHSSSYTVLNSIAFPLGTDLANGIRGDEEDVANRQEAFGNNTYKKPASHGLLHFVWEAFKDFTILILLFCAALSLGLGIKQKGPKEGWHDGGSIFVAVFLVIAVSSLRNYSQSRQTPLQAQLNRVASSMGMLGLAVAFLVFAVLLVRYFTGHIKDETGPESRKNVLNAITRFIASAVTIVVVAIPVGLPLAVSLILGYSKKKMIADKAIVPKLSTCEILGSVTTICTSKTGILTHNQMRVTTMWFGHGEPMEQSATSAIAPKLLKLIQEGVGLNTACTADRSSPSLDSMFSGSPTEEALLSWAVTELNMDLQEVKQGCEILQVEPFNSHTRRSGILLRCEEANHVHWKGGSEIILGMCSLYYDASANLKAIDSVAKITIEQIMKKMADSSLRCIAFAHKKIPPEEDERSAGNATQRLHDEGLTFLGIVGISDPCRPEVTQAVRDCQNARVNIKMITGENRFTAQDIATKCGILRPGQDPEAAVIEGTKFRNLTQEQRMERVEQISIMARSSSSDKLLMVQCLKQKGHVVIVTGNGTNEAPSALKEADIGLCIGTEHAKASSDIVILDDNFTSVAKVVGWGRCIYNNIQKFIQFQLAVNVAALAINFVAAVSTGEVPLSSVQLLWVNLLMDTLGALALATEKPTKELMDKAPVGRTTSIITNVMLTNLISQALFQIIILLTLHFKGEAIFGVSSTVNDTLLFNTFVLCQVFNEFNTRKLEEMNILDGILKDKLFIAIICITIALQVVMIELLKKFANAEKLTWGQWSACIGIAAASCVKKSVMGLILGLGG